MAVRSRVPAINVCFLKKSVMETPACGKIIIMYVRRIPDMLSNSVTAYAHLKLSAFPIAQVKKPQRSPTTPAFFDLHT